MIQPTDSTLSRALAHCHDWLANQGHMSLETVIETLPNPEVVIQGKRFISFSSNNYLGLSHRPEVIAAASLALNKYSMGTCESRRLGGNLALLETLEERIARFKGTPSAMVFATGLLANVAVIPGLMNARWYCNHFFGMPWDKKPGIIFSDDQNHRSIQMGIKLSRAKSVTYRHGDMDHLQQLMEQHQNPNKLIVTDTVFSMGGDMAPLPEIIRLANHWDAEVMVDDAHGTGVFGASGRGAAEHLNVEGQIGIQMGTLSKALGGLGGFVAATPKIIDFLKTTASGYRFTSSLPAEQAAGIICAFDLLEQETDLRIKLWQNVYRVLQGVTDLMLPIPLQWSPILPLSFGGQEKTFEAERILLKNGLLCVAVVPPLVKSSESRLRISINATHTSFHLDKLMSSLEEVSHRLKLPKVTRDLGERMEWKHFLHNTPDYIRQMIQIQEIKNPR